MSKILLIAMENGRSGVKTYGTSCSNNMTRRLILLCLVSFSGRAIADIEFYPDFRRPERDSESKWDKVTDETEPEDLTSVVKLAKFLHDYRRSFPVQSYAYRREQQPTRVENPPSFLPPIRSSIRRQHVLDPDFSYRVPEETKSNYEYSESSNNRPRNPGMADLDPDFTYRIPSRMRADEDYSSSNSDFSFHDEMDEGNADGGTRTENEDNSEPSLKPDKTLNISDEPGQFAYPPSDPRYYEDTPPVTEEETKQQKPKSTSSNQYLRKQQQRQQQQQEQVQEVKGGNEDDDDDTEDYLAVNSRQENSAPQESISSGATRYSTVNGRVGGVLTMEELQREIDRSVQMMPMQHHLNPDDTAGVYIIAVVAGISAAATVGLIAFGIGWYNLQKHVKNAADVEYPAYGVTGPNKDVSPSGDRRLAQSAQMYHYQHQKQQIIAMERAATGDGRHGSLSEADSDEENEEGDYTVYECPGLAPTGEMEVKNPLFHDDPTPAANVATKNGSSTNNVQ